MKKIIFTAFLMLFASFALAENPYTDIEDDDAMLLFDALDVPEQVTQSDLGEIIHYKTLEGCTCARAENSTGMDEYSCVFFEDLTDDQMAEIYGALSVEEEKVARAGATTFTKTLGDMVFKRTVILTGHGRLNKYKFSIFGET